MKVLIAGSTGMIGSLVMQHCLQSNKITEVRTLVRKASLNEKNEKLNETIVSDFEDYTDVSAVFENIDIAFFCIGVYTGQVPATQFEKITVNYAVAFAQALQNQATNATLCFLSGAGADRTEQSSTAFARLKGMAENKIAKTGLTFYAFRPAYIYPVTPRQEPNLLYRVSRLCYPIIKLFGKNASIKSTELAKAMFTVGLNGTDKEILENRDIIQQLQSVE